MMSKSWMGSIESIELDWREGVFVETYASPPAVIHTAGHGSMRALDVPVAVYYDAKCCLCEWAYEEREGVAVLPSVIAVSYAFRTPDIREMNRWCGTHQSGKAHVLALREFTSRQCRPSKKGP